MHSNTSGVCCDGNFSYSSHPLLIFSCAAWNWKVCSLLLRKLHKVTYAGLLVLFCFCVKDGVISHLLQVLDKMGCMVVSLLYLLPTCPAHLCCSPHFLWQQPGRLDTPCTSHPWILFSDNPFLGQPTRWKMRRVFNLEDAWTEKAKVLQRWSQRQRWGQRGHPR